jgi:Uma2 family endonuclease
VVAARTTSSAPPPEPGEVRLVVHGVSWKDYVIAREALDGPGLRMTYCEGELELMSPQRPREEWKTNIARLVELFALERDVPLYGYDSTTFKSAAKERGGEPDECYCVGGEMREWPEIVIAALARFAVRSDQPQALKEWRQIVASGA